MAIPLSRKPQPFCCKEDEGKPPGEQTRFMLRDFDHGQWARFFESLGAEGGSLRIGGSLANEVLMECLAGWDNFRDEDGPIPFDPKDMGANLDRMTAAQRMECAAELFARNKMTETDRKNLPLPRGARRAG